MSSTLTGNKIKDSYQALLKMGTNGSLDPVTPIAISDGLGNDTPLLLSGIEFKTQVVSASKLYGYWADLSANSHVAIGDYANEYNGTKLYLSDSSQLIRTEFGYNPIGISLNFTNNEFILGTGDFGFVANYNNSCAIGDYGWISNGTYLLIDSTNNYIITWSNNNQIGLSLDYKNNQYYFGDWNGIGGNGSYLYLDSDFGSSQLYLNSNSLSLYKNNNVYLGDNSDYDLDSNNGAVTNSYLFGTNWYVSNTDKDKYPFFYNTILNCYNNNLNTSAIALSYSLFANIQDPGFDLHHGVSLFDNNSVSNCFIFGLTNYIDSSNLQIFEKSGIPTNVVVINGSNIKFGEQTSSVFSVNASSLEIKKINSGINIIGGDFAYDESLFPANHQFVGDGKYGITVQGRNAYIKNNFAYVKAEYFGGYGTHRGQVQVEEIQLFQYYGDGSLANTMQDTLGIENFYVQNSSTYTVEFKIVSTTGDGDNGITGNSYTNITYIVCVDSGGHVQISDYCEGCHWNPHNALVWELSTPNLNYIKLSVAPDTFDGHTCWVKAYMTLSCITAA